MTYSRVLLKLSGEVFGGEPESALTLMLFKELPRRSPMSLDLVLRLQLLSVVEIISVVRNCNNVEWIDLVRITWECSAQL